MPAGVAPGILKGLYLLRESRVAADRPRVQLLGSGAILREVIAAADLLEGDFAVGADVWSVPSFTELRREGLAAERWSLLHPEAAAPAELRRDMSGQSPRPSGGGHRLCAPVCRPDPALCV